MIGNSTARTRLCPNCANSISEDAPKCSYCKTELAAEITPRWLKRDAPSPDPRPAAKRIRRFSLPAKFVWPVVTLAAVVTAFFAGGYIQRRELSLAAQANLRQLQARDQIIQNHETQLAQTRQQLSESADQMAELKSRLAESRKELSAAQQRLAAARRADRSAAAPSAQAAARPAQAARAATRVAGPGLYETIQATAVHESPSSSSRAVSQIARGTRINVIGASGEWLEVRSRNGNPPGFVRSVDARPIARAN